MVHIYKTGIQGEKRNILHAITKMEIASIPEEYFDSLVQEFSYDPVRLPITKDPTQVLYNRGTLETIWDMKHEVVNPFTRQPFDISDAIPQAELRQQMCQYIASNRGLTPSLQVIPDYTKVLSKCLIIAQKSKMSKSQKEQYRKALWQRFNLLRLHCQYRAENRELFSSIRGYDSLKQVVTE